MRKLLYAVWWCIPVLLATACRTGMTEECFDGEEGYISLHFARVETRAEVDDSGAGSFTEGDRIGLFIDNGETVSYRELTRTSGE